MDDSDCTSPNTGALLRSSRTWTRRRGVVGRHAPVIEVTNPEVIRAIREQREKYAREMEEAEQKANREKAVRALKAGVISSPIRPPLQTSPTRQVNRYREESLVLPAVTARPPAQRASPEYLNIKRDSYSTGRDAMRYRLTDSTGRYRPPPQSQSSRDESAWRYQQTQSYMPPDYSYEVPRADRSGHVCRNVPPAHWPQPPPPQGYYNTSPTMHQYSNVPPQTQWKYPSPMKDYYSIPPRSYQRPAYTPEEQYPQYRPATPKGVRDTTQWKPTEIQPLKNQQVTSISASSQRDDFYNMAPPRITPEEKPRNVWSASQTQPSPEPIYVNIPYESQWKSMEIREQDLEQNKAVPKEQSPSPMKHYHNVAASEWTHSTDSLYDVPSNLQSGAYRTLSPEQWKQHVSRAETDTILYETRPLKEERPPSKLPPSLPPPVGAYRTLSPEKWQRNMPSDTSLFKPQSGEADTILYEALPLKQQRQPSPLPPPLPPPRVKTQPVRSTFIPPLVPSLHPTEHMFFDTSINRENISAMSAIPAASTIRRPNALQGAIISPGQSAMADKSAFHGSQWALPSIEVPPKFSTPILPTHLGPEYNIPETAPPPAPALPPAPTPVPPPPPIPSEMEKGRIRIPTPFMKWQGRAVLRPDIVPRERHHDDQQTDECETTQTTDLQSLKPDGFIGSNNVMALNKLVFKPFIDDKEVALVMFYDPQHFNSSFGRFHIRSAARNTNRPNHAYAGVDCTVQRELCNEENITKYPTFRLYSRGALVNTFNEDRPFMAGEMKKFVEEAPVIQELPRPRNKCKD